MYYNCTGHKYVNDRRQRTIIVATASNHNTNIATTKARPTVARCVCVCVTVERIRKGHKQILCSSSDCFSGHTECRGCLFDVVCLACPVLFVLFHCFLSFGNLCYARLMFDDIRAHVRLDKEKTAAYSALQ